MEMTFWLLQAEAAFAGGGAVMDFYEVFDRALALLRQRGRVSYRALKVQFHLDDEQLDALKEELLYTHQGAVEEDGPGLVWTGGASDTPAPTLKPGQPAEVGERPEEPLPRGGSPPAAPCAPDAERQLLLTGATPDLTHHHQPGMAPQAHAQVRPPLLLQAGVELAHRLHDAQPRPHGPLRIIFVC